MKSSANLKTQEAEYSRSLRFFSTIKIGGAARYFFMPADMKELQEIVVRLAKEEVPYVVLGCGSNILISDDPLPFAVIKLGEGFSSIRRVGEDLFCVGAGTPLAKLLKYCIMYNVGGMEPFAGIPATVGGMACMNAACFNCDFLSLVEEVRIIDRKGADHSFTKNVIRYGYRMSNLDRFVITEVVLRLGNDPQIRQKIASHLAKRIATQDLTKPSLGCIFKNPPGYSAGSLIDQCELKGLKVGDAAISEVHANFIVNGGNATARDVDTLIALVKEKVWEKSKVMLSEEIRRWGP